MEQYRSHVVKKVRLIFINIKLPRQLEQIPKILEKLRSRLTEMHNMIILFDNYDFPN